MTRKKSLPPAPEGHDISTSPQSVENGVELAAFEESLCEQGHSGVCGVDEVGRGPLAGPVVAAAVIIPPGFTLDGLDDSKRLSPKMREELFSALVQLNLPLAVGIIDSETIDRVNILKASLLAMRQAVLSLKVLPTIILVDGTYTVPNLLQPQHAIVEGDGRCRSIAAASIIAKVTRDRIMDHYQSLYPQFSFSAHKGYPTPAHLSELEQHGPCPIHRKSFRPVARYFENYVLFE